MSPVRKWLTRRVALPVGAALIGATVTLPGMAVARASGRASTGHPAGAVSTAAGHPLTPPVAAERAAATFEALQRELYLSRYRLYPCDETCTETNRFGTLWPYTNAFAATDYLAGIHGVGRQFRGDLTAMNQGLDAYRDQHEVSPDGRSQPPAYASIVEPPLASGGPTFYDDNAWVALDELYAYGLTRSPADLHTAEGIFRFVVTGWDTNPAAPCPGGVFWEDTAGSARNTVSNAPNAEVGALLYLDTGQRAYLRWARRMYAWVRGCLRTPDGMYDDHVNADGTINTALWSYNQGTMIGAGTLLYRATGDPTYLKQAEQTATASLRYYGRGDNLYRQPEVFDVIFFRNLWYLATVSHRPAYLRLIASYAATAWHRDRQPDGLFTDPDPSGGEDLVNQTAPMVELYALLAGSPPMPVTRARLGR